MPNSRAARAIRRRLARLVTSLRSHAGRFGSRRKLTIREAHLTSTADVVAFSLYGTNPKYVKGGLLNIDSYRTHFPGYVCRFYVAEDVGERTIGELKGAGAEVVIMAARGIDATYMFWRFLASEDLSKRRFLIRDIDSAASARERTFHDKWLATGKRWWILRDHYSHGMRMMGGMWGGHPVEGLITEALPALWRYGNCYNRDQMFLSDLVYPRIRHDAEVQDIIRRFQDEDVSLNEVDTSQFGFVGEIATDTALREEWRRQFRLKHERRASGAS